MKSDETWLWDPEHSWNDQLPNIARTCAAAPGCTFQARARLILEHSFAVQMEGSWACKGQWNWPAFKLSALRREALYKSMEGFGGGQVPLQGLEVTNNSIIVHDATSQHFQNHRLISAVLQAIITSVFKDSQSITTSKGPWEDPERFSDYAGDGKKLMYSAYLIAVFVTGVCMWSQWLCAVIISMAIHIHVYMYTSYAYDMV